MALPRWLKPENADNRLFLAAGRLHLVPLDPTAPHLTQQEGIRNVRNAEATLAPAEMEAAVQARISSYPQAAKEHKHTVRCFLPLPAAHVLRHAPSLVASAVQGLCDRDQEGMKACRSMWTFPPAGPSVMAMISFPRLRYAQLSHEAFTPPKCFPPLPRNEHPDHKALSLGAKLAAGLEMLCAAGTSGAAATAAASAAEDTCTTTAEAEAPRKRQDPNWPKFEAALRSRGYFGAEMDGSREYQRLAEAAWEHFVEQGGIHYYRTCLLYKEVFPI